MTDEGIETGITIEQEIDAAHDRQDTEGVESLTLIRIPRAETIVLAREKIDIPAETVGETIGRGTAIAVTDPVEAIGTIEGCRGEMRGETILIVHPVGTGIYSRVAWSGALAEGVEVRQGVIAMSSLCRWVVGTGRRAPVLHPKKRSLLLI